MQVEIYVFSKFQNWLANWTRGNEEEKERGREKIKKIIQFKNYI